jgi:hypothetical protein
MNDSAASPDGHSVHNAISSCLAAQARAGASTEDQISALVASQCMLFAQMHQTKPSSLGVMIGMSVSEILRSIIDADRACEIREAKAKGHAAPSSPRTMPDALVITVMVGLLRSLPDRLEDAKNPLWVSRAILLPLLIHLNRHFGAGTAEQVIPAILPDLLHASRS